MEPTTGSPTTSEPTSLSPTSVPTGAPVVCIPIIDKNTFCGRQLSQSDCENNEVSDCVWDATLGCHEVCAYDLSVCDGCGCVQLGEDCITRTVLEEAQNAAMRVDVFIEEELAANQMIEGVNDVYVYIGITMFALMLIGAIAFMAYKYNRRQKKKYMEMEEENINALQMDEIEVEEFGTR